MAGGGGSTFEAEGARRSSFATKDEKTVGFVPDESSAGAGEASFEDCSEPAAAKADWLLIMPCDARKFLILERISATLLPSCAKGCQHVLPRSEYKRSKSVEG